VNDYPYPSTTFTDVEKIQYLEQENKRLVEKVKSIVHSRGKLIQILEQVGIRPNILQKILEEVE